VSEQALRQKIERQQRAIELLEAMIEDHSRDVFLVNEELASTNARLRSSLEEQQSMQRTLIDASRKAGMADVATSVLHNVGNVLNSVNVSANLVLGIVDRSRGASLPKAIALLRSQPDPGRFLTEDPRGKKLIDFIEGVATALASERASAVEELRALEKNIEHIKVIVAEQQSCARGSGAVEIVSLRGIVDDAVRGNRASFDRHSTRVVRELEGTDEIAVDRHRLYQILMNLLTNAGHAVKGNEGERRVVVRTRDAGELAVIEIADNGVGIAAEHLVRIFAHGFTTKPEGHGFGLHSCACTAGEMGGRGEVASDGPGLGATFTLFLPRRSR